MALLTTNWISGTVAANIPEELFGGQDWTNPDGGFSTSSGDVASNEVSKIAAFSRTNLLLVTGFTWNFTIEDFYTIVEVRYRYTRRCTNNPTSQMRSYDERLYHDGAAVGNNLAVFTNYPAAYTQIEGGGDLDTIGASITPAMVNDSSFGFYVGAQNNDTDTGTAEVYNFQMQLVVDDDPPPPPPVPATPGALKTQGSQIWIIDADASGGPEIMAIACPVSIEGAGGARDQIDSTCLEDPARSYEAGLITPSTASLNLNFDPDNESHIRLHDMYRQGTRFDMAIGFSDGTAAPVLDSGGGFDFPTSRSFLFFADCYVSDFTIGFSLNSAVQGAVTVQLSGLKQIYPKS